MPTIAQLEVGVTLNDQATAGLQGLGRTVDQIGANTGRATGYLSQQAQRYLGSDIQSAARTVQSHLDSATETAKDYNQALADIRAVGGEDSIKYARQMDETIQDLAGSTRYNLTETAGAWESLAKAGLDYQQITGGALEGALDLAAAGGIAPEYAAEAIAAAMSAYGMEGSEATKVADMFTGAANASLASVEDLAIGGAQAAGVFAMAQEPIEDYLTLLSVMTDRGLSGSDAATSMKVALNQLLAPIGQAAKEQAALGVNTRDAAGEFIGMHDMAEQLVGIYDALGYSSADQLASIKKLAGQDGYRALLFAMDAVRKEGSETAKGWDDVEKAVTAVDAANKAATERMNTAEGASEQLAGAQDNLKNAIAGPAVEASIGPTLKAAEATTWLTDQIKKIDPAYRTAGWAAANMAAKTAELAGQALYAAPGLYYAREALNDIRTSGGRGAQMLGLFTKAAKFAGIAGIAAGVGIAAYEGNVLGFGDAVDNAVSGISQFGRRWKSSFGARQAQGATMMGAALGAVGDGLFVATQGAVDIIPEMEALGTAADVAGGVFANLRADGVDPASAGLAAFGTFAADATRIITGSLGPAIQDHLGPAAASEFSQFGEQAAQVFDEITHSATQFGNALQAGGMGAAIGTLGNSLEDIGTQAQQAGTKLMDFAEESAVALGVPRETAAQIRDAIGGVMGTATDIGGEAFQGLQAAGSALADFGGQVADFAGLVAQGDFQGASDMVMEGIQGASDAAMQAVQGAGEAFGGIDWHSLLTLDSGELANMQDAGNQIGSTLGEAMVNGLVAAGGLKDQLQQELLPNLRDAIDGIGKDLQTGFMDMLSGGVSGADRGRAAALGGEAVGATGLAEGFRDMLGAIKDSFANEFQAAFAEGTLPTPSSDFITKPLQEMVDNAASAVEGMFGPLIQAVQSAALDLTTALNDIPGVDLDQQQRDLEDQVYGDRYRELMATYGQSASEGVEMTADEIADAYNEYEDMTTDAAREAEAAHRDALAREQKETQDFFKDEATQNSRSIVDALGDAVQWIQDNAPLEYDQPVALAGMIPTGATADEVAAQAAEDAALIADKTAEYQRRAAAAAAAAAQPTAPLKVGTPEADTPIGGAEGAGQGAQMVEQWSQSIISEIQAAGPAAAAQIQQALQAVITQAMSGISMMGGGATGGATGAMQGRAAGMGAAPVSGTGGIGSQLVQQWAQGIVAEIQGAAGTVVPMIQQAFQGVIQQAMSAVSAGGLGAGGAAPTGAMQGRAAGMGAGVVEGTAGALGAGAEGAAPAAGAAGGIGTQLIQQWAAGVVAEINAAAPAAIAQITAAIQAVVAQVQAAMQSAMAGGAGGMAPGSVPGAAGATMPVSPGLGGGTMAPAGLPAAGGATGAGGGLAAQITAEFQAAAQAATAGGQQIVAAVQGAASAVQGAMTQLGQSFTQGASQVQAGVDAIVAAVNTLPAALSAAAGAAGAAAGSIGDAIVAALQADVGAVQAAAGELAAAAQVGLDAGIQPGSPSKMAIPYGQAIGEGLIYGMQQQSPEITQAAKMLGYAAEDGLQPLMDSVSMTGMAAANALGVDMEQALAEQVIGMEGWDPKSQIDMADLAAITDAAKKLEQYGKNKGDEVATAAAGAFQGLASNMMGVLAGTETYLDEDAAKAALDSFRKLDSKTKQMLGEGVGEALQDTYEEANITIGDVIKQRMGGRLGEGMPDIGSMFKERQEMILRRMLGQSTLEQKAQAAAEDGLGLVIDKVKSGLMQGAQSAESAMQGAVEQAMGSIGGPGEAMKGQMLGGGMMGGAAGGSMEEVGWGICECMAGANEEMMSKLGVGDLGTTIGGGLSMLGHDLSGAIAPGMTDFAKSMQQYAVDNPTQMHNPDWMSGTPGLSDASCTKMCTDSTDAMGAAAGDAAGSALGDMMPEMPTMPTAADIGGATGGALGSALGDTASQCTSLCSGTEDALAGGLASGVGEGLASGLGAGLPAEITPSSAKDLGTEIKKKFGFTQPTIPGAEPMTTPTDMGMGMGLPTGGLAEDAMSTMGGEGCTSLCDDAGLGSAASDLSSAGTDMAGQIESLVGQMQSDIMSGIQSGLTGGGMTSGIPSGVTVPPLIHQLNPNINAALNFDLAKTNPHAAALIAGGADVSGAVIPPTANLSGGPLAGGAPTQLPDVNVNLVVDGGGLTNTVMGNAVIPLRSAYQNRMSGSSLRMSRGRR